MITARYTLFAWNQYGQLAYRNTGQVVTKGYTVRGNTVYGENGRKIGNVGKGTAAQQRKVRQVATAGGRKAAESAKNRYSFSNIRKARERAMRAPEGLQLTRPPATKDQIRNFGKAVKSMALYSQEIDPAITAKIKAMDNQKLMTLYQEQEMVFDVYFDYGDVKAGKTGMRGGPETAKNAQALIDAYEARFGTIGIQSRL